jgi:hypothetical protein
MGSVGESSTDQSLADGTIFTYGNGRQVRGNCSMTIAAVPGGSPVAAHARPTAVKSDEPALPFARVVVAGVHLPMKPLPCIQVWATSAGSWPLTSTSVFRSCMTGVVRAWEIGAKTFVRAGWAL